MNQKRYWLWGGVIMVGLFILSYIGLLYGVSLYDNNLGGTPYVYLIAPLILTAYISSIIGNGSPLTALILSVVVCFFIGAGIGAAVQKIMNRSKNNGQSIY